MTISARNGTTTSHAATSRPPEKNSSFAAPMVARAYTRSRIRVPMVADATNRSNGATLNTNQARRMMTATATATVAVERTGTPLRAETVPSGGGPTSSRERAYSSRVAPTTHASAQPKALTAAPIVMSSPTHPATNRLPRSPSSEPEAIKSSTPFLSVPKPITSMAVTKTKYRPPKMATPRIARGMSLRGSRASSPSVAAASNPAKERNPKTTPRKTAEVPVPWGTVKTEKSRVFPFGAVPVASLTRMTTLTIRIRATVVASMTSRTLVPSRMLEAASAHTPANAIAPTTNGAQPGWFVQMPRLSRKSAPKIPDAVAVTTP